MSRVLEPPSFRWQQGSDGHLRLTPTFSLRAFRCRDGSLVPKQVQGKTQELARNLWGFRDNVGGRTVKIVSGYRSPKYNEGLRKQSKNRNVAKNSLHVKGEAADIVVSGMKPTQVRSKILELIGKDQMKQGGVGLYKSWVHYDIRGYRKRWGEKTQK